MIDIKTLLSKEIHELEGTFIDTPFSPVKDISIKDLAHQTTKGFTGYGVYLFKLNEEIIYIGKAASRQFVTRIPAHFVPNKDAWFNRLLKLIVEKKMKVELTDENLTLALNNYFDELSLLLINFSINEELETSKISELERILRITINSAYNKFKSLELDDEVLKTKLDNHFKKL